MKYIILESKDGGAPWVILFLAPLTHREIAEMAAPRGFRPISAGYYDSAKEETFGSSSTLGLVPATRDTRLIRAMIRSTMATAPRPVGHSLTSELDDRDRQASRDTAAFLSGTPRNHMTGKMG